MRSIYLSLAKVLVMNILGALQACRESSIPNIGDKQR